MNKNDLLLNSAMAVENTMHPTASIVHWLKQRNEDVQVNIKKVGLSNLSKWTYSKTSSISHESGKFFTIDGIHVETNMEWSPVWDQPIINQPEIGYLGIITKEFDGVLYFLMQAKVEPGNLNHVQLSPTLQATRSNFTRVHGGNKPNYVDFFLNANQEDILLDQLQSEQGARFLRKRNRNIIIKVVDNIQVLEDFKWMTLGQIKELMLVDNVINMDTRTVISGISFENTNFHNPENISSFGAKIIQSLKSSSGLLTFDEHLSWLTRLKSHYFLSLKNIPLERISNWVLDEDEIYHEDKKYFKIIGVDVSISNREVFQWSQPLIEPMQQGLCAFIVKFIKGNLHFLVQAKLECGNLDVMELAPTVQCLTGNLGDEQVVRPPFLDIVHDSSKHKVLVDVMQSEEGGRFYLEQNRNMIVQVEDSFEVELPNRYTWMSLNQLKTFLKFNNYLNIQARSLLAAINFYL